jgi:aspartate/methionine/tyrosine aminotransferase
MFSKRVPADLAPNALTAALAAHRHSGRPLFDLTATNPTTAGIPYPTDVLAPLSTPEGRIYRPEPFGLRSAREAVSRDFARLGTRVAPERIVLTASTSEAYSLLFKLLCDAGDDVLIPSPSYPLFDHLSALDGVGASRYRLDYHGRWALDVGSLDAAWTPAVRALLAVNPNNPTGSVLSRTELAVMAARCAERGAALIIDEVFADYPLGGAAVASSHDSSAAALTFRLGGLSKSAGLPQVKLGWIAVDGPGELVRDALARLEIICDTYLSVSTPVQIAAGALIESGAQARAAILARIRENYAHLAERARNAPSIELLHADAGWAAVLRVPATRSEEDVVMDLLVGHAVLVHPGYFFDFDREAFLVVSLLPAGEVFAEGIDRLVNSIHE